MSLLFSGGPYFGVRRNAISSSFGLKAAAAAEVTAAVRGETGKSPSTQRFRWSFRREFSLSLQALFSACVLRTASANISRS